MSRNYTFNPSTRSFDRASDDPRLSPIPSKPVRCKFCDAQCDNAAQMQDHLNREHPGWANRVFRMLKKPE